ncbi:MULTISPECIES: helix-turn-helix transcriptional regulator [Paraburkholderia]|uniref:DNA-binding CsgD family transcriptional regulator n=2 Tax=Paraburkholderia TaxID=1822464 RepID=A0A7Y9WJ59_9BURK|nr:LuxR C-terminal-related transcriptional regulator [Paraburkholderia bryophila]NYH19187.1 DNA-binding CsgD family transcriptional regulator [Paraburkholderia bryophila]NYH21849.1 DNA-binding CsgD family transcriptional regulator [Paraburkholderia bryophila]
MDRLFTEVAMHQALARVIDHLGGPRFWRNLILLLDEVMPFDNALAVLIGPDGVPRVLDEFDTGGTDVPSPVPLYLNGLYLLDPFLQAAHDGLADGLYRLEEVAPDLFRQSEYFLSYFRDAVGEDELQLIVKLAPTHDVVSLSLGAKTRFDVEALGRLAVCAPWLIATIRQHQARLATEPGKRADSGDLSGRVERALAGFGAELLSEREMSIARLVLRGNSSKAIAERLAISPETVKVHRRNLYNKLGISTQPELFSLFIQALGHEEQ